MKVVSISPQGLAAPPPAGEGELPGNQNMRRRRMPKWHLIYYVLAIIDLATVSGSLYLNHQIMRIYTNSVEVNQGWAAHLAGLGDLGQHAGAVNAPGNDIFDSKDVAAELKRQKEALGAYERHYAQLHDNIIKDAAPAQVDELHARLDAIEAAMSEMLAEADLIFSYFRKNQAENAGRHMASMDRKFANLSAAIAATAQSMRAIQAGLFEKQVAEAAFLRKFEYLFGALILLMVGCVTVYGHKIAGEFRRGEEERTRYLDALRQEETKKIELERKLRQSQKMDALGTLAGGMAHEFNNILTPMIGLTKLTLRTLTAEGVGQSNLKKVIESGERAKKLIAQVLNFSREKPRESSTVALGTVVREALGILTPTVPASVTLRHQSTTSRDRVRADPIEMHQVLMNLVGNAVHALKGNNGTIDITLATVTVGADEARILHLAPGDYVRLSVADTGCGMDEKTMARVFEPFFTTKGVGEGTGLGLSVVHGIVVDNGGVIKVFSRVNEGTRFDLWFPVAADIVEEDHMDIALKTLSARPWREPAGA
jgi:two-component system, NtrC family, sensor kinase